jgi:hypothetical protein
MNMLGVPKYTVNMLLGWVGLMGLLGRRVGFKENWPELEVSVLQIFE